MNFGSFLHQLRALSAESERRVIVITDNAKYHHGRPHKQWREQQAPESVLDSMPAYSPELNPIERVWRRTRRNCVHNIYFPTLHVLVARVDQQSAKWSEPNDELTRLCTV